LIVNGEDWWIDGLVQLQGRITTDERNAFREPGIRAFAWSRNGLPVQRTVLRASWLQGTVWATNPGEPTGFLIWHYVDGSTEKVPLTYGQTTARFWGDLDQVKRETDFPEPVWQHHEPAQLVGKERWLRLYEQSWDNLRPGVLVTSLDFVSNKNSPAAPFIVAINTFP
jgi:hypothetical protein